MSRTGHRTLRLIMRRAFARRLNECDQCPARHGQACYDDCRYVTVYGYPTRKDTR